MSRLIDPPVASEAVVLTSGPFSFTKENIVAIYVGGAGTVYAKLAADSTVRAWSGCAAGSYLIGQFTQVLSAGSGTTATFLIGCCAPGHAVTGA